MINWPIIKTSELIKAGVLEIGDGYRAKNSEMGDTGLPFIRAGDVNGNVNTLGCDLLDVAHVNRIGNKRSRAGDVVLTTKGTVGRVAFVSEQTPDFVYSPQLCFWRSLRPDNLKPRFLFYCLQSDALRHQMNWSAGQTDMAPYISLTDQRNAFEIRLPEVSVQEKISDILGSLDDKIELNRQMNETLEAMAQAIFRDWFVDFGPTRRKMEGASDPVEIMGGLVTDAERARQLADLFPAKLGDDGLPEGWEERQIGDLAEIVGGSTPATGNSEFWDGGHHAWATPKDLSKLDGVFLYDTERRITDAGLSKIGSGLSPVGTVLLSSRAPIGYLAIADCPVAVNQGFIAIRPTMELPTSVALLWCRENMDLIKSHANGSTFQEISKKNFRPLPVLSGGVAIAEAFDEIVAPMFEMKRVRGHESHTLATTRDLLLPKLMSGEIRLREAEEHLEAAQ